MSPLGETGQSVWDIAQYRFSQLHVNLQLSLTIQIKGKTQMAILGLTNITENKKFTLWVAFTKSLFPTRPSRVCSCSSGPHSGLCFLSLLLLVPLRLCCPVDIICLWVVTPALLSTVHQRLVSYWRAPALSTSKIVMRPIHPVCFSCVPSKSTPFHPIHLFFSDPVFLYFLFVCP